MDDGGCTDGGDRYKGKTGGQEAWAIGSGSWGSKNGVSWGAS